MSYINSTQQNNKSKLNISLVNHFTLCLYIVMFQHRISNKNCIMTLLSLVSAGQYFSKLFPQIFIDLTPNILPHDAFRYASAATSSHEAFLASSNVICPNSVRSYTTHLHAAKSPQLDSKIKSMIVRTP